MAHTRNVGMRAGIPMRLLVGWAIVLSGFAVLVLQFWQSVQGNSAVQGALIGGSVAALATALGTVPVMFSQRLSDRTQDSLFGFGAGVMLAACAFSLIIPGIAAARASGASAWGAGGVVVAVAAYLAAWPVPIQPVAWSAPVATCSQRRRSALDSTVANALLASGEGSATAAAR